MTILTEREVRRNPPRSRTRRASDLTPDEHTNVRAALRFLARKLATLAKLADALTVRRSLVQRAVRIRGRPSAALAIQTAHVPVHVEEALMGTWAKSV
jgi:hypothetical protein